MIKIFEKDHKTNFVDDNNVFVGYDSRSDCCEEFGYNITKSKVFDMDIHNDEDITEDVLENYSFNAEYVPVEAVAHPKDSENVYSVTFKLVSDDDDEDLPDLYLHLYNAHNGYYSHGFEFGIGNGEISLSGRI